MRVVLAIDGSAAAGTAVELVAACPWPLDTAIDVVGVLDAPALLPAPFAPGAADVAPLEDALRDGLREAIDAVAVRLRGAGLTVSALLAEGRPVDRIVERAEAVAADLVVCGSRGHGELRTLLLGSVSAALADRAPCPILVARRTTLERMLLAHDGTEPALAAESVVACWPVFRDVPVDVLTVASVHPAWRSAAAMLTVGPGLAGYQTGVHEAHERVRHVQADVLARLHAEGRQATGRVRDGDPASAILDEAAATGADLIVLGSHGRTGIDRLMLGSVARAVLLHADASVLIVPPGVPAVTRHGFGLCCRRVPSERVDRTGSASVPEGRRLI